MQYFQSKDNEMLSNVMNTLDYFIEYSKKRPSNYINFSLNKDLLKSKVAHKIKRGYFQCEYLIHKDNDNLYSNETVTKYIEDIFHSKENKKNQFLVQDKDEYALCFPFYKPNANYISPLFFTKVIFRRNQISKNFEITLGETCVVESTLSRIIRELRICDEDADNFITIYSAMVQDINTAILNLGDLSCYTMSNLSKQLIQIFTTHGCNIDKRLFAYDRFMILNDITIFISNKTHRAFMDIKNKIVDKNTTIPLRNYLGLEQSKSYSIADVIPTIHRGGYFRTYTVNEKQAKILSALNQSDLLSISGPPGTGKTTILKEIIADYAVRRAGILIKKMESGDLRLSPQELHSIIVTSSQNKAVDNIGDELAKEIDYFRCLSDNGYFCARLGNQNNIDACRDQFHLLKEHLEEICNDNEELEKYSKNFKLYSHYYQTLNHIIDSLTLVLNCDLIPDVHKTLNMTTNDRRAFFKNIVTDTISRCFDDIKAVDLNANQDALHNLRTSYSNNLNGLYNAIKEICIKAEKENAEIEKSIPDLQATIKRYELAIQDNNIRILQLNNAGFFKKLFCKSKINNEIALHTEENNKYNTLLSESVSHYDSLLLKQQKNTNAKHVAEIQLSIVDSSIKNLLQIKELFNLINNVEIEYNHICSHGIDYFNISNDDIESLTKSVNKYPDPEFGWAQLPLVRHLLFLYSVKIHECFVVLNASHILRKVERMFGGENIPVDETIGLLYPVVTATLLSLCDNKKFDSTKPCFHLMICDESGQAEPHLAIPVLNKVEKAIIAGDIKQLAPVVIEEDKKFAKELEEKYTSKNNRIVISLLDNSVQKQADTKSDFKERYTENDDFVGIIMNEHRRCEESIVDYSNHKIYGSKLEIVDRDSDHYIIANDIKYPKLLGSNVVFLDVCGKSVNNENKKEAHVCQVLLEQLNDIFKGCDNHDRVGIITPYRNQKNLLKETIEKCEYEIIDAEDDIGTVHNFQGQGRDIIIVSLCFDENVPSRLDEFINSNFLNVAFTRAKKQLIILGNYDACMKYHSPVKDAITFYANLSKTDAVNKFQRIKPKFYSPYLDDESKFHNSLLDENIDNKLMLSIFQPFVSPIHIPNLFKNFFINSSFVKEGSNKEILPFVLNQQIPKKSLLIVSPWITHWVVDDEFVNKIASLANNGVEVKICYGHNKTDSTDIKEQLLVDGLLKSDSDIDKTYNQIIKLKKVLGENLVRVNGSHSKIIIIDDKYCFAGSYNWLCNSNERNKEVTVFVEDEHEILKLKELY